MKKIIILVIGLLLFANSLYTSDYWIKNSNNDSNIEEELTGNVEIETVCNLVDLSISPYNHTGVVRSGYLKIGKGSSALSFIFYGRQKTDISEITKYSTIIWLNGGPGSSSQIANFMVLGPTYVKSAPMAPYQLVKNEYSWVKNYNVLFVDQPVGTGLSYADTTFTNVFCKTMDEVANDFWTALKELYTNPKGCFSELKISPNQDLLIFGEGYAGKYVPAIGQKIKKQQDAGGFLKGLKGIGIGDGFTMPATIITEVGSYAYHLGLIDYQQRSKVEQMILNATYQNRIRDWTAFHHSFDNVINYIRRRAGNVNQYDMTKYSSYPNNLINQYLNSNETRQLFKFTQNHRFDSQSHLVYQALFEDYMKPCSQLVQYLLLKKVYVLIYNGQNDLIVQTPGTLKWVQRIHHDQAQKFRNTLFKVWKTGAKTSGYMKSAGYLQLRTVNNAGHLVPMDQGEAALNMVTDFIKKCTGK